MNITYCITKFNFFSAHQGGQISHALGIVNGLTSNKIKCKYIGPKNDFFKNDFFNSTSNHLIFKIKIYYFIFFLLKRNKKILIRKNIENIILIFFLSFFLSKKQRESIIFEINGFTFERYLESFIAKKIYSLILLVHKIILSRFKYVYVVSSKLRSDLVTGHFKLKTENIAYIPNGVDIRPFNRELVIKNPKFVFLFFGVFQDYNDYLLVISAFRAIRKKYGKIVELHFIGFGKNEKLLKSCSDDSLGIFVHPPKNMSELNSMSLFSNFCIGLIPLSKNISVKYLSPIKLFDYINMGMPVIVSDMYSDAKDLPNISDFILKYKADDSLSLFNSMNLLVLKSRTYYEFIYSNKNNFCSENSWTKRMKKLTDNFINK